MSSSFWSRLRAWSRGEAPLSSLSSGMSLPSLEGRVPPNPEKELLAVGRKAFSRPGEAREHAYSGPLPATAQSLIQYLQERGYAADAIARSVEISRGEARTLARWAFAEIQEVMKGYYQAREETGVHIYPDPKLDKDKEARWGRAKRVLLGLSDREPLLSAAELAWVQGYISRERWYPCHNMVRVLRCLYLGQNRELTEEGLRKVVGGDHLYSEVLERAFRHPSATPRIWRMAFGFGSTQQGHLHRWILEQPGALEDEDLLKALLGSLNPSSELLSRAAATPLPEIWLRVVEQLLRRQPLGRRGGLAERLLEGRQGKPVPQVLSELLDQASPEQARLLPTQVQMQLLRSPFEEVRLSAMRLIARGQASSPSAPLSPAPRAESPFQR